MKLDSVRCESWRSILDRAVEESRHLNPHKRGDWSKHLLCSALDTCIRQFASVGGAAIKEDVLVLWACRGADIAEQRVAVAAMESPRPGRYLVDALRRLDRNLDAPAGTRVPSASRSR